MSSSGLIYAFIVGAWAVYLVPMWLRREDELNEARQTRRYTTAIKVLAHKDSFERRYGQVEEGAEADEARLPVAVGQGAAPEAGRETLERVRAKERAARVEEGEETRRESAPRESASGSGQAARRPAPAPAPASAPASGKKPVVAATRPRRPEVRANVGSVPGPSRGLGAPSSAPRRTANPMAPERTAAASASSPMLRARRRRVVGVLFAVTSLGAIVSMDLGLRFVWAMLLPAAVLSAYIAWVRKDERARAAERARLRAQAAETAREARETQRRRRQEHDLELAERAAADRDEHARREAAARRRASAARARADRRTTTPAPGTGADPHDLPRAANG